MSVAVEVLQDLAAERLAESTRLRHDARDHYRVGTRHYQTLIARAQIADAAAGVLLAAMVQVKRREVAVAQEVAA